MHPLCACLQASTAFRLRDGYKTRLRARSGRSPPYALACRRREQYNTRLRLARSGRILPRRTASRLRDEHNTRLRLALGLAYIQDARSAAMRRFRLRPGLARAALPCGAPVPLVWPGMDCGRVRANCGRVRVAPAMPVGLVVARGILLRNFFFFLLYRK
jgi:hypothetical protein